MLEALSQTKIFKMVTQVIVNCLWDFDVDNIRVKLHYI